MIFASKILLWHIYTTFGEQTALKVCVPSSCSWLMYREMEPTIMGFGLPPDELQANEKWPPPAFPYSPQEENPPSKPNLAVMANGTKLFCPSVFVAAGHSWAM